MDELVGTLTFAEWIEFESRRIASLGLSVQAHTPELAEGWIEAQVAGAIRTAYAHGRDGLTRDDLVCHGRLPWYG